MVLLSLVLAHLFADFVFQPQKLVEWKRKSYKGFIAHLAIVFITNSLLLFTQISTWYLLSIIAVSIHGILDYLKIRIEKNPKSIKYIFPIFITEQAFHIGIVLGILMFLRFPILTKNQLPGRMIIINGFFMVTFFAGALTKTVGRQIAGNNYMKESKFKNLSIIERGVLYLFLVLNIYFFIPLIFLVRIYLQKLEIFTKYRTEFLIGTSFTVFVFIFVKSVII